MSPSAIMAFTAVSFAIIVVPGPSVLFAISRAIVGGRRSGLLTVLGNAAGLFVQVIVVALGMGVLVGSSVEAYMVLKLTGATYLVWLGISAIRHRHATAETLTGRVRSPVSVTDSRITRRIRPCAYQHAKGASGKSSLASSCPNRAANST